MNAPPEEAEAHSRVSRRENRLYVGNLSYSCTYRDLRDFMMGGALALEHFTLGLPVRRTVKDGGRIRTLRCKVKVLRLDRMETQMEMEARSISARKARRDLVIHPDDSVMDWMGRVT